jgi:outer membrane protein assembly factor BamB
MKRRAPIFLGAILTLLLRKASATSFYVPQFSTPILVGDKVIFGAPEFPGTGTHRLICVEKHDGKKVWEKTEDTDKIRPWFVLNGQIIVTIGTVIEQCDPQSGKCERLYTTGFDRDVYLRNRKDGVLVVGGPKNNVDYLSLVDPKSWNKLWEVSRIVLPVAQGNDTILCEQADQHAEPNGGYSLRNEKWVALAKSDGHVAWSCPYSLFESAEAVSNYFLVSLNDSIQCLNQGDGTAVSRFKWQRQPYVSAQLLTRDQELLVQTTQFGTINFPERPILFSLSVPDLKWRKLSEEEWKSALKEKSEVKDGTYLFYSSISSNWKTTSLCREEIKTGNVKELYQEPVPKAYSRIR